MKLVVCEFLSLDGVVQGPGSVEEDTSGGFDRGGWMVPAATGTGWGEVVDSWFARTTEVLLGRSTYTMMHEFWSRVTDPDDRVAAVLNGHPKHLVSSTVTDPPWQHTSLVTGDLREAVSALKGRDGDELQVHGSWQLAVWLHQQGLVEEYRLITFPVVVGAGKRLLEPGRASGFEPVESRAFPDGVSYVALRPTPFRQGAYVVEDGRDVTVLD